MPPTRGEYVYVPVLPWEKPGVPPAELHQLAIVLGVAVAPFDAPSYRVRSCKTRRAGVIRASRLIPAGRIDGHTLTLANGAVAPVWCPDCADCLTGEYRALGAESRQRFDWYVCDRCGHEFTVAELLARTSYTRAALSQSAAHGLADLVFAFERHRRPPAHPSDH